MQELFGSQVPCVKGCVELGFASDRCGFHEDRADIVVEAVEPVGVIVPVLQLEAAVVVASGPALPLGVGVGGGRDGRDVDGRSPVWAGGGNLGDQVSAEAQRVSLSAGQCGGSASVLMLPYLP
ncbi:hypothetical protein [Dactylosporangium cerinum]